MPEDEDHLELVLELAPGGEPSVVSRWLGEHGLQTSPLVVGVLASGSAGAVRRAFGEQLDVPPDLREHVVSIKISPPKAWHLRS